VTWIVGTPTICGYGFALSDIRVTLKDGRELDCLQKIYPVGRHLAAGFAGSVGIGFAMMSELRRLTSYKDDRMACDPDAVAAQWPGCAQSIFESFPKEERDLKCHLMLICSHPVAHNGNPAWPRACVMIFKSPDFIVECVPIHQLGSIGSGDAYEPCRSVVNRFMDDYKFREILMKGESGTQGGMGTMLGINLTTTLKEVQPRGVSPHLHYCWVYRGRTIIQTNDHTEKGRWSIIPLGSGINMSERNAMTNKSETSMPDGYTSFEMPEIAKNLDELNNILGRKGMSTVGCVA
jgi:hypothetical protein